MLDWMAELLDLPASFRSDSPSGGGVIQGSASEATLVAILSARWRATGGAVNHDGDTSRLVAYATARPTRASRRDCASPASARTGCASCPTTSRSPCGPTRWPSMIDAERGGRAGAVLRVRDARDDVVDGVRPDARDRRGVPRRRRVAARRRGDERHRRARARAPLGQRTGSSSPTATARTPHKWMGVNFDCDLYWTADRAALLGALSHPARVPPLGGRRDRARRSTTATGRSRSGAASGRSSCG